MHLGEGLDALNEDFGGVLCRGAVKCEVLHDTRGEASPISMIRSKVLNPFGSERMTASLSAKIGAQGPATPKGDGRHD